jgi:DNA-binding MarR family transcriptional regulator
MWERSGLTLPQLRVLFAIRREPGITTGDLARALGITVSTTSGLIAKLVERGLVERGSTPGDRRLLPLRLTSAGAQLTGDLSTAGTVYLRQVADQLGADLPAVTAVLARLAEAAAQVRARDGAPSAVAAGSPPPGGAP